ncbi:MAG: hypothetical protein JNL28_05865 [Planctomycetes bacterium]|nr:hypothetical protein [Planctomycetota bacterium]
MNMRPLLTLAGLTCALAFAPAATAQDLGIRFQKKNVSVGLHIGNRPAPHRPPARPMGYAQREWVPSHYETITEQVWVPGREERVYIPARYEWRYDACGRAYQVLVCPARYETRCTPGRFETRTREVWVEGGWRVKHCAY